MEFVNETDCQQISAGMQETGVQILADCDQRLPEDFLKEQITTWLVEYASADGLTHTSETYTGYDSCNARANELKNAGLTVTEWCLII
jgi:hypothetical protein